MSWIDDFNKKAYTKKEFYPPVSRIHHSLFVYFFVRLLINTRVTPNMVTTFATIITLAGAGFLATGDYKLSVIGGILMFFSIVFDGVDGELARRKKLGSKLGEWYDKISDNVSNPIIFFAIGWGIYQNTPDVAVWYWTFIAFAAYELSTIIQYNYRKVYAKAFDTIKQQRKKLGIFRDVAVHSYFLDHLILIAAILNMLYPMMIFLAIYGWIFNAAITVFMTRKILRAKD